MGETLLTLTIITLIIITILKARPVILENPVSIHRPGQFHITLAPQLNQAQSFVEQIAKQFIESYHPKGDLPTQYFEVRDPKVYSKGQKSYLLAISLRGGELYFQAANPNAPKQEAGSHYKTLREYSESVLQNHPLSGSEDESGVESLRSTVEGIAAPLQISVEVLPPGE
ncbi:MAG: hypothetical protein LJE57_02825 [Gallionella sp.]|nr:hypothetical protein [Gallionella sp.]